MKKLIKEIKDSYKDYKNEKNFEIKEIKKQILFLKLSILKTIIIFKKDKLKRDIKTKIKLFEIWNKENDSF